MEPRDPVQAALRRALARAAGGVPDVPPKVRFELRRKLVHVVVAIVSVPLLLAVPLAAALGLATLGIVVISLTWFLEQRRGRLRLPHSYEELVHEPVALALKATRREGEGFPWSPVLYTVSLSLIALAHAFLGLPWSIAFAAYAILGLGDAASALVGVAYGRHKLPWNRRKSYEGTAAGLVAGFTAGCVMGAVPFALAGALVPPLFFVLVLAGALAGTLAESLPRVEDNFVVPLSAAAVMMGLTRLLDVPLAA